MYNKILVGVDASENSTRALQVAAELSKEFGAELHVFHAIAHHYEPLTVPGQPGPRPVDDQPGQRAVASDAGA